MPILFMKEPLGVLISCGPLDGSGLTLAVMAAPCDLREKPERLAPATAQLLDLLAAAPQRATDQTRFRYERLREAGLAQLDSGLWYITPKGRDWRSRRPPPSTRGRPGRRPGPARPKPEARQGGAR